MVRMRKILVIFVLWLVLLCILRKIMGFTLHQAVMLWQLIETVLVSLAVGRVAVQLASARLVIDKIVEIEIHRIGAAQVTARAIVRIIVGMII